jgi:hypothetical protein
MKRVRTLAQIKRMMWEQALARAQNPPPPENNKTAYDHLVSEGYVLYDGNVWKHPYSRYRPDPVTWSTLQHLQTYFDGVEPDA